MSLRVEYIPYYFIDVHSKDLYLPHFMYHNVLSLYTLLLGMLSMCGEE